MTSTHRVGVASNHLSVLRKSSSRSYSGVQRGAEHQLRVWRPAIILSSIDLLDKRLRLWHHSHLSLSSSASACGAAGARRALPEKRSAGAPLRSEVIERTTYLQQLEGWSSTPNETEAEKSKFGDGCFRWDL
jgi:hypothetical protein